MTAFQPFPKIAGGTVNTIVEDGRGGWFVGGEFAAIGGVACANLAHVTARNVVDRRWCPRPRGKVVALARRSSTLFVGGELGRIVFTDAGGERERLTTFDRNLPERATARTGGRDDDAVSVGRPRGRASEASRRPAARA